MMKASNIGSQTQEHWLIGHLKNMITAVVTGYILFISDVVGVMLFSKLIFRKILYISILFHFMFACIGIYITFVVTPRNPNWEATHMNTIYTATAFMVTGGFLWMIAVWPVFHFWTILLGFAWLFFFFSVITLLPGKKKKIE